MSAYKVTGYREDSDADDEYERDSVFMSPTLPPEGYSASPTDSDGQSTEPTPTTYTHSGMAASPRGLISDWSAEQSADFVSGLGLPQYADKFVEEAITGDALMALLHSDLKEMGITSIGHRLTILKAVYDLKIKQHLPIEPDDYVPLSADAETQDSAPTQDDIARIINIIKDRDAELRTLREELVRISEENRKLREDVLPIIKDRKNSIQESRLQDSSSLDPSAAAVAATNHLTASMRDDAAGGRSPNAASQPSPTSPAYSSLNVPSSGGAKTFDRSDSYSTFSTRDKEATTPSTLNPPSSARENPQVEIFKSFRVSIEDPCHKVLPVALKKYNITADWRQYALYIVHGDQERCLGLNEKPLILFKQLDREGRKPMFMLRKHASPMEGISSTVGEGGAQAALAQREAMQASGGGRSMQLPGGVL
ncbi:hypothetical protein, variant [Verruconis gallopava]|uniref:Protein STE50 n=1 Tax=Verruconis gallopava TaxID=253628 RepID=A0A0D2AAI9_9PEZI|nr:hypothetical protein, variant [Verruconis gallopava]KIW03793.1 hypothetical protein, variant [Verruconis gallopava]